jgi:hypothetical protein
MTTSLVTRDVRAHHSLTGHLDPVIKFDDALLAAVKLYSVLADRDCGRHVFAIMSACAVRLIKQHWTLDWFEKVLDNVNDSMWLSAADDSHRILRLVATNAKQKGGLETSEPARAQSIGRCQRCTKSINSC